MKLLLTVIVPFNLIKATLNGVLVFVVYKRISPILKAAHWELPARPLRIGRLETPG
jgi:riboflavin transporter FmnP